jgi:hypothetical protein
MKNDQAEIPADLREWAQRLLAAESDVRHSHDFDPWTNVGGEPSDRALDEALRRVGPPVTAQTKDERIGNAPDANVGWKRDDQNAARERVAKWGRIANDDSCRFIRGCGNDLSLYVSGSTSGAYASISIDEDGDAVVAYSNRDTEEILVREVSPQAVAELFAKLAGDLAKAKAEL